MAANKGEITYEIRADDSNVEKDIEQANKKVEQAAEKSADDIVKVEEEKTQKIKSESDKTVKSAEKAADDVAEAWKDAGQDAKEALSDIADEEIDISVDAETEKAETAIREVGKDKSVEVDIEADNSEAKEEIEELEDVAEEVGESISGNLGKALKDSFSEAAEGALPLLGKVEGLTAGLSGTSAAVIGLGAAAASVGVIAVGTANDMKKAMNDFQAETGKSREEVERYQGVLEKIYANNYGEDFTDIADAMAQVTKNLGEMDDSSLQNVTESAFALRDTFEYDITESTRAAKAMMDNFGTSGEEAMNLIAAGAQNGLDYSGELLDNISEYSVQFAKLGLDADDMFKIFQTGADTGAWNLDKIGDAVKELSIRVIDGSETTREGFETIGLDADEMSAKFAAGGDSAKEAFQETVKALASIEDPLAQNIAGVDLFGTMWEDLGPEVVTTLADIEDGAYDTADAMEGIKKVKYDDLSSMFESLKRNVELLILPLGESLMPILLTLIQAVLPIIQNLLVPLIDLVAQLLDPILSLITGALNPLTEAFTILMESALNPLIDLLKNTFMSVVQLVFDTVASVVDDKVGKVSDILRKLQGIFSNLIDFIRNVFTGNWRGAWENVRNIFANAVGALEGIFKAPINAIVNGWNSLASTLGSVKVPEWVPIAGGKSFSLPKLTRLRVGMDYVPSDDFPALLHRGEAVLTAEENRRLMEAGGLSGIESAIARDGRNMQTVSDFSYTFHDEGSKQPIRIEVPVNIEGREAARAIAWYMGEQLSWEEM